MQGSPQRKKARFSEHPQIFQYSSKSKKDNETDNESLLLDSNDEEGRSQQKIFKVEQKEQIDSNAERQLQIDQISSDLAQIQAYLQQQSKPIYQPQPPSHPQLNTTPLKPYPDPLHINIKPDLKSGRDTMNIQQQIRVRSTIKELQQDEISNNKKRMMNEQKIQKQKQKNIQQRLGDQIRKNKRITMDVKQLMNILNQYQSQDEQRKAREERKNRITMDVYALSKFLEDVQEDKQEEFNTLKTPIKTLEKSIRQNKVFSAFKQSPHSAQVKMFAKNYVAEVSKRFQEKQQFTKKLNEQLNQLKSEIVKIDLRISDARKRAEKRVQEKQTLERQLKSMTQQLNRKRYLDDLQTIRNIQRDLDLKILKLSVQDNGCYGHFIFDGIYMKAKAKGKSNGIQIKLSVSAQEKQNEKSVFISIEDSMKLLRKQSIRLQQKNEAFLDSVIAIRRGYQRLRKLQNDIYYFSLGFEIKEFQINPSSEKICFQVFIESNRFFLFQVNIALLLYDGLDSNCLSIYDPMKPGYLKVDTQAKPLQSVLFQKMKKIIQFAF